jgi:uncharacterized protein with gpF-like domain
MIVTNANQIPQLRDKLVRKQIKLEKQVQPVIKSLLRIIGKDATAIYIRNRRIINTNNYESDMTSILRGHYRKVIDKFGFGIREQFNIPIRKDINSDFNAEASLYINNHSEDQAEVIMNTQQDVVERNINKALFAVLGLLETPQEQLDALRLLPQSIQRQQMQFLIDTNQTITQATKNREFAKQMKIAFTQSSEGRASVIATTETNDLANFAMQTEAEVIVAPQNRDEAIAAGIAVALLQKEWVTVRDNKVRPTHVAADRQIVPIGTPFRVGGARLQRPSDSSLGAPPRETVNCRCKVFTVISRAVVGGLGAEALLQ